MSRTCRRIQQRLALAGAAAVRDDTAAQRHLEACSACFEALEAQAALDAALRELPTHDAPDEVVAELLDKVADGPPGRPPDEAPRRPWWRRLGEAWRLPPLRFPRRWMVTGAVAAVATATLAIVLVRRIGDEPVVSHNVFVGGLAPLTEPEAVQQELQERVEQRLEELKAMGALGDTREVAPPERPAAPAARRARIPMPDPTPADEPVVVGEADDREGETGASALGEAGRSSRMKAEEEVLQPAMSLLEPPKDAMKKDVGGLASGEGGGKGSVADADGHELRKSLEALQAQAPFLRQNAPSARLERRRRDLVDELNAEVDSSSGLAGGRPAEPAAAPSAPPPESRRRAQEFLAQQTAVEGLDFQDASGYWENAYVPGDPFFRYLHHRLVGQDEAAIPGVTGLDLHRGVRRTAQPFDPPQRSALAVYLHADRRSIAERGRVRLQVGLKATDRRSGRRPVMNVGIVLDLRGEARAAISGPVRALVNAFAQARDLGDRFHLVLAGRPGGVVVGPDGFRHGPLLVAMDTALGLSGGTDPSLGLLEAVEEAMERVSRDDDPHAPLGSSLVVLVTSQPLGEVDRLVQLAHTSAVGGVPLSVVAVGDTAVAEEVERLSLAGQGNLRFLQAAAEAPPLVHRELSAVSRVVARAVRLRIRLAPGVELIEVLGSRQLGGSAAERVREAERSVDLRLARNLGIEADRGEDEEGIQIVIPTFYAGDSHVVLVDVVVPGPGPVADVTVRYKDLVHLRNGVARANLSLRRGEGSPGPLELNVTKNLLALGLFEALEAAGQSLAGGDRAGAASRLATYRQLLEGMRGEIPELAADGDLQADLALLGEYLSLLGSEVDDPGERQHLADSLRYSSRLKLLQAPQDDGR